MKVLALDAAAIRTGWAVLVFDGDSPRLLDYGSVELPEKMRIGERLSLFQKTIRSLVEEYKPDRISLEEAYIRFVQTSKTLLKIAGAVEQIAYELTGREAVVIHPSTVRAQLGIKTKGDAAKKEAAALVKKKFGVKNMEFDETDAIVVGWVTPAIIRRKECKKPRRKRKKKKPSS